MSHPPSDRLRSRILAGYSYKSNEYGLSLDNVAGYELVLPNGTIKSVTAKDKDLWFGLRVGRRCCLIQMSTAYVIAGRGK